MNAATALAVFAAWVDDDSAAGHDVSDDEDISAITDGNKCLARAWTVNRRENFAFGDCLSERRVVDHGHVHTSLP
jgi:hypothetical protein